MDDHVNGIKGKRIKPIWIWVSLFMVLMVLCIAAIVIGGGIYVKRVREQATETRQAELWITGTAEAHATGTAVAQMAMTSTSQALSTATARAQQEMTSTARAAATGTAQIYANRTSTAHAIDTRVAGDLATRFAPVTMTLEACARLSDLAPENWRVALCDEFDNNDYQWPTGYYDEELATCTRTISNGTLRWETYAKDGFYWPMYPNVESLADFYVSVDVLVESGPEDSSYGIQFRWDEDRDNFYQFALSEFGNYSIFAYINDEWITLVDWQMHNAINVGMLNTIAVITQGPTMDFYVNGQRVDTVIDRRLSSGIIGLFVGLYEPDEEAEFVFDHFEVRAP